MTVAELCAELVKLREQWLKHAESLGHFAANEEDEDLDIMLCASKVAIQFCADQLQDVIDEHCLPPDQAKSIGKS